MHDRLELQQMIIVKEAILEVPSYVTLVNINNQLSAVICIHKKHTEKQVNLWPIKTDRSECWCDHEINETSLRELSDRGPKNFHNVRNGDERHCVCLELPKKIE